MCLIIEEKAPFKVNGEVFLVTRCLIFLPKLVGVVCPYFMGDLVEIFESIGVVREKSILMKERFHSVSFSRETFAKSFLL